MLIQTIGYRVEAPGATVTDCEPFPGDSLEVGMAIEGSEVSLLDWATVAETGGEARLIWPSGHDTSYGLSVPISADERCGHIVPPRAARLRPGETIRASASGGTSSGFYTLGLLTVYYESLPGVDGRYITADELRSRMKQALSHLIDVSDPTPAAWGAEETLDASRDTLKPGADYAWVGCRHYGSAIGVALRGPDTGNVRCGMPTVTDHAGDMESYWVRLSLASGLPCIPVIRGGNAGGTYVDVVSNNEPAQTEVGLLLVELES